MEIDIVAGDGRSLRGFVFILLSQRLKAIENLLSYQVTLLNPAFGAGCGAHSNKTPVMLQNIHPVAILYGSGFVENRRYVVAQKGLRSGNIGGFEDTATASIASRKKQWDGQQQRRESPFKS